MEASFEHPWLGSVRRYGDDQLISRIDIPTDIRPAARNGDASAEVLIEGAPQQRTSSRSPTTLPAASRPRSLT